MVFGSEIVSSVTNSYVAEADMKHERILKDAKELLNLLNTKEDDETK